MYKNLKIFFFILLFFVAGYFFGRVCGEIENKYKLVLNLSPQIFSFFIQLIISSVFLILAGALNAVLLRPLFLGIFAVIFSGIGILWGWRPEFPAGIMGGVYICGATFFLLDVVRNLEQKISFSAESLRASLNLFSTTLVVMSCGILYFSLNQYINKEDFILPPFVIKIVQSQFEEAVLSDVPPEKYKEVRRRFRKEFPTHFQRMFQKKISPYKKYIPLGIIFFIWLLLMPVFQLLSWLCVYILKVIFIVLNKLGVTKEVIEMREIKRLSI